MTKTILVVDDDPKFRDLVISELEAHGHRVVQAEKALDAMAVLHTDSCDLAIVDGNLPDTHGLDLIRNARSKGFSLPIVFVSASWKDSAAIARVAGELRIAVVLHKPIVPSLLAETVDGILEKAGQKTVSSRGADIGGILEALRRDYLSDLPEKVRVLADSINSSRRLPEETAVLDDAKALAHRLAGTAGSYGFLEVGECAQKLESNLEQLNPAEPSRRILLWAEVDALLLQIKQIVEREQVIATGSIPPSSLPVCTRLLMVDDDPVFLAYVDTLARKRMIEVIRATSEDEAVEKARRTTPDIAVIDVQLGDERSFSLAHKLRALPGCENLPLAFVSSDATMTNRVAAAHAGASLYLTKPIDPTSFDTAIQHLITIVQSERPHVLLVDGGSNNSSFDITAILTQAGMRVSTLEDASRILEKLDEDSADLIILDVTMAGVSGFDVCRMLRTTPRYRNRPILFLTARAGRASRVAAFKAGCDDYLIKPVIPEELLARIHIRLERTKLTEELAGKDSLTGLLLRRALLERLEVRIAEATRHHLSLTLCLIDLDHFKIINDERGHLAGDQVLMGLGKLLTSRFRTEDLRGRWGGEEFILAFPGEIRATAHEVLMRVLGEFKLMTFTDKNGGKFSATFSAGVASLPEDGTAVDMLVQVADKRLYAAKKAGRCRVVSED